MDYSILLFIVMPCRAKYESSAKNSALYDLQSTVQKELSELRGVGLDMSMVGSRRLTFNAANSIVKKSEDVREIDDSALGTAVPGPAGLAEDYPALHQHQQPAIAGQDQDQSQSQGQENDAVFRLSRLILAEEQIRSTSRGAASRQDAAESGADIVSSVVSESILNAAFERQQTESNSTSPHR